MSKLSTIGEVLLMVRHIVSFSTGIPSAIVAYLVCQEHPDAIILFSDVLWEDDDNYRFYRDVEQLLNKKIVYLTLGKTPLEIADDEGYAFVPNSYTATCTRKGKIEVIRDFMQEGDILYLGMTHQDKAKGRDLNAPIKNWAKIGVTVKYPLIENNIEPFEFAKSLNLDNLLMYKLKYPHANCGGRCVKQGAGSWIRTLIHFPNRFDECEQWEQDKLQKQSTRIITEMILLASLSPHYLLFCKISSLHTFLTRQVDGVKYIYSLKDLRLEHEQAHRQPSFFDIVDELNGYGCTVECGIGDDRELSQIEWSLN